MNTRRQRFSAGPLHPIWVALLGLLVAILAGCSRAHYRRQADRESYALIECGSTDPRWPLDDFNIDPDPQSRFYDPNPPDCPPMPPDDPTAHRLMHCVDGKRAWPWEDNYGRTQFVENPNWKDYLPYDAEGTVVLDRDAAMQLALVHSREYQLELENLYQSALSVSLERFRFDTQFFGGNTTFFNVSGPLSGQAGSGSTLSTSTDAQMRRLMATGGELLVDFANSVVWQFSGTDSYTSITPLSFSLLQPLLRGAGRAVVLEQLTESERALLAQIRDLERFRREFYIQIVAGGGGQAGAFLGLLRDEVQIRNQVRNVAALQDSVLQLETAYEFGQESLQSVELARQDLFAAQSSLLSARAGYETSLDRYKVNLGLPPDLDLRIEDPLLERFNLIDPAMTAVEDTVDFLGDELRDPDKPMPDDYPSRLAAVRQASVTQLDAVQDDLEQLLGALPKRGEDLHRLSTREEFQRGEVDPSAGSVDLLHQRVVALNADFLGVGDPYVEELAGELLTTPDQQDWFEELKQRLRGAGVEGVAVSLTKSLAELEAFEQDPSAATAAANAEIRAGEKPKTTKEVLADLVTQLSRRLLRLSLVQARARLDAITLVPVDLGPEEALEIARENRRDWMNARAELVDSWRQIELAANDLRSDLDVEFSGDLSTRSGTFGAENTTGNLRARLAFDAPLTRLAERNAYRGTLISYQQARRNYYAFEDDINQSLRGLLRTIRLDQLDFEISRGSVFIAITRVDQARRKLEQPPGVGGGAGTKGGLAATQELVRSLNDLLRAQNNFAASWVDYEVRRMTLDLDLGTMELDDRSMWIDPGPVQGGGLGPFEGPEEIPPGLDAWPAPELLPPAEASDPQEALIRDVAGAHQGDPATRPVAFRPSEP